MEETQWQQNEKKTSYYPRIQSTNNENGEKINKGDNRGEEKLLNKINVVEYRRNGDVCSCEDINGCLIDISIIPRHGNYHQQISFD